MLDAALTSVFGTTDSLVASVSTVDFLMCCAASIVLGAAVACVYMFRRNYSKNFVVTLALLPLIVQMVITLVNGNLGAGIAVMGVFNLVRFRSIPGSAKDIGSVFLAMAIGLATGMGFIALAVLFAIIVGIVKTVKPPATSARRVLAATWARAVLAKKRASPARLAMVRSQAQIVQRLTALQLQAMLPGASAAKAAMRPRLLTTARRRQTMALPTTRSLRAQVRVAKAARVAA